MQNFGELIWNYPYRSIAHIAAVYYATALNMSSFWTSPMTANMTNAMQKKTSPGIIDWLH